MKIKNILAVTALVGLGMTAQAAPIVFNFLSDGSNVALGSSHTFTSGGASLTAYASTSALYAKNSNGEQGLGLTGDPTGDNEIWAGQFVQLLSQTGSSQFTISSLSFDSTTAGETSDIYFSTVQGVLGILIGSVNSNTSFNILSAYQNGYLGVTAGGIGGGGTGLEPANVLIASATGYVPDGGTTVAMLGGALTALGLIRRKLVA
ncbi:MAG: motif [Verrucomicrobiota bacterium]|jgi:hypothetical protein